MSTTDDNNEQQCSDSGEMTLNKDKCTSCKQNNIDDITEGINSVAILDDKSICANCGKNGNDVKNTCNKCKMVKYCNAACKKKHRHKHKKECEEYVRVAAEHAAKLHDIELFKQQPPPKEDCPICFLRLPTYRSGWRYFACCGKMICSGCCYAPIYDNQGNEVDNEKCPFCRTPWHSSDEAKVKRYEKRVEANDPHAIYNQGVYFRDAMIGFPQDYNKALELWHQSGYKLGHAKSYGNIGDLYDNGFGAEVDKEKAKHYYELAAMGGDVLARHRLGLEEEEKGNMDRAIRHYMIAARSGDSDSLNMIKKLYTNGHATKEDYTKALQLYQEYLSEIKSVQRDKAAADDEDCRYY